MAPHIGKEEEKIVMRSREIKLSYLFKSPAGLVLERILSLNEIERDRTLSGPLDFDGKFIARRQYTGLRDKNGKEIFEGDILRHTRINMKDPTCSWHGEDLINVCEIYWSHAKHGFRERGKFPDGGGWDGGLEFNDSRADNSIIEVIGNIYENPELLGDKSHEQE